MGSDQRRRERELIVFSDGERKKGRDRDCEGKMKREGERGRER